MSSKKKFEILKQELMNYNEIELIEFDNKYKSLVYTEYNKLFDKLDKLDKKLCSRNVKNTDYENYEKQKNYVMILLRWKVNFTTINNFYISNNAVVINNTLILCPM